MSKKTPIDIIRYNPDLKVGLNDEQVNERKTNGLTNLSKVNVGKTYWEIIRTNVLSFFNILLFIIAGFMIYAEHYSGLFFLTVLIPNIIIGLYQDIKAKKLLSKLQLMTQPTATVIRNGEYIEIPSSEVVLDDIVSLKAGAQIVCDGVVLEGEASCNESLLTGESNNIKKQQGDTVFAGTFVVSGNVLVKAIAVGDSNYIASIQKSANKFKRSDSQILRSLKILFLVIGIIVVIIGITTITLYAFQGTLQNEENIKSSIGNISGSMVSMVPSGLYLLTSMALASAVMALAKKKAQVQDFYSVEMLARVNALCVDKTGTVTDGTMVFKEMVVLSDLYSKDEVKQIISNVLIATNDSNFTAIALKKEFNYELTAGIKKSLPFSSEYKCSGASFQGGKNYIIGAPEFLNIANKSQVLERVNFYTRLGNRVVVLAESSKVVGEHKDDVMKPIAIIVLQDHVKEDAPKTFKWFAENGVKIRVISGDNAITTSEVAKVAGIKDADMYVSLEGKTDEEVKELATKYTVFGRVTPEQKAIIVTALKQQGDTVAMTGDGVNDILALKRADCSIAMASGSDAARNVSHIVLLDSNFSRLPDVVAEGRRVINNLQRTCSVFLVKTMFAMLASIAFIVMSFALKSPSIRYPFLTNNLYLWEILGIGMPAFFLALQKSNEQIKGNFLSNTLKKSVPPGIIVFIGVCIIYSLFIIQNTTGVFTGVLANADDQFVSNAAHSMSVLFFSLFGSIVLFKVCSPFDRYRRLVFSIATGVMLGLLTVSYFQQLHMGSNLFLINFSDLSPLNYIEALIVLIVLASIYFLVTYISEAIKGEHLNDKN